MEQNKVGILFSGGLESTSLISHYQKLHYKILLVYIKYGYIWEETEVKYAQKIADFYSIEMDILDYSKILNIKQLGKVSSVKENIIPLRNLSLFTFSAMYLYNKQIFKLASGLQGSKEYPDTSLIYISQIQKLIQDGLMYDDFTIETPFYGVLKEEIIRNHKEIPLNLIFSCTNPSNGKMCHKCYKCKILDDLLSKYLI